MTAHVEQPDHTFVREIGWTPICGVHFCDTCGDCLSCFESDDCGDVPGQSHVWVLYLGDDRP